MHELVDDGAVQDGVDDEMELGPVAEPLDVRERPGGEVVERPDLVAGVEQELAEMRADEAGPTCDEHLGHGREDTRAGGPFGPAAPRDFGAFRKRSLTRR